MFNSAALCAAGSTSAHQSILARLLGGGGGGDLPQTLWDAQFSNGVYTLGTDSAVIGDLFVEDAVNWSAFDPSTYVVPGIGLQETFDEGDSSWTRQWAVFSPTLLTQLQSGIVLLLEGNLTVGDSTIALDFQTQPVYFEAETQRDFAGFGAVGNDFQQVDTSSGAGPTKMASIVEDHKVTVAVNVTSNVATAEDDTVVLADVTSAAIRAWEGAIMTRARAWPLSAFTAETLRTLTS